MLTKRKSLMASPEENTSEPIVSVVSGNLVSTSPKQPLPLGHKINNSDMDSLENVSSVETPLFDMEEDNKERSIQQDGLAIKNYKTLTYLYFITQGIGLFLLFLVFLWIVIFLEGFGFSKPGITFNFHPMFMSLGFIFIYGNAILIYRVQRKQPKTKLKQHHAIRNGIQLAISGLGSISAFYFHQKAGIPHFYSLHSWLGLLTWVSFTSQFCIGLYVFLYPMAKYSVRQMLMPYHRFLGVAIYVLATATCLTGLNEKAIFSLSGSPKYSELPPAGVLINFIGLTLIVYSSLTVYLATKPEYIRNALPEEQVININLNN